MKKNAIQLAIIGLGGRGRGLMNDCVLPRENVVVAALCDLYEDKMQMACDTVMKEKGYRPLMTTDYHEILAMKPDAVLISSAWESHIPIAIDAMKAGIPVACEVGGAYTLEDCFRLVRTYEETKTPIMMLENCCYGREELLVMNMVRQGLFGEVVSCEGGYRHDLRREVTRGEELRHYRLRNYQHRNCENYPTHELGPIAKILNINRGNRMISLVSMASKAAGLNEYVRQKQGADHPLASYPFAQGDVVTTIIKCAHGETITLTLDTCLPRFYSRNFNIHGTKALYHEDTRSLFIDGEHDPFHFEWKEQWNNIEKYYEKYEHPIWKKSLEDGVRGGHGGMDWLEFNAFFEALTEKHEMPVDVYDMAAWMAITPLSEQSIAQGSAPVAIPDFTNGMWTMRKPEENWLYRLSDVYEEK